MVKKKKGNEKKSSSKVYAPVEENLDTVNSIRRSFKDYFTEIYDRIRTMKWTKEDRRWIKTIKPTYRKYLKQRRNYPDIWAEEAKKHGLSDVAIEVERKLDELYLFQ